ncbi:MAG: hypothetical protein EON60_11710 [Alphaproteobacteria bacterium]|nr:MAG: hypothetical protein EON60_11710 [Alphaproteobacteria bacterium]
MKHIGMRSIGLFVALLLLGSVLSIPFVNPASRHGSVTGTMAFPALPENPFDLELRDILSGKVADITARTAAGRTLADTAPLDFYREAVRREAKRGMGIVQVKARDDPHIVAHDSVAQMGDIHFAQGYAQRMGERLNSKTVRVRSAYDGLTLVWDHKPAK